MQPISQWFTIEPSIKLNGILPHVLTYSRHVNLLHPNPTKNETTKENKCSNSLVTGLEKITQLQ